MTLKELRDLRAKALADAEALANLPEEDFKEKQKDYDALIVQADEITARIKRVTELNERLAASAQPAVETVEKQADPKVPAALETDKYAKDKSLLLGAFAKTIGLANGNVYGAHTAAKDIYGENHPVTKALVTNIGASGGFIVPPDVMNEIIPLLRAQAVVRSAGPRTMPMPRGTMTIPGQASAATASYGAEGARITQSQPTLNQIVASYKKLTALVPVSNDMMRYADPSVDAFVRDDLVKVIALREDLAFILGDGTVDTPRGYLFFANAWVAAKGGTLGVWSTSANSTYAVNATDPANSTGGNFVTANQTYTLATAASELGGAVNRLDQANVPDNKRVWFMNPRVFNYLFNVQNSLGLYVYRDELTRGTLLGYPFKKTTQIGTNYWDSSGTNKDLSFVFLVEMTEDIVLDSMTLELAVSREGTYVDSSGNTVYAFQSDQTIIRAIAEHDHHLRHDAAVAVIQNVRWAPAIS